MATAKSKTAVATAPGKGTAVVSWKDKAKQYAKASAETAAASGVGGGFKINAKKGKLYYDGSPVAGNALDVIVLDDVIENAYYDMDFDPDNPRSPVCFAFGRGGDEMRPHADSKEPQHDTCKGCPMNEFGTADKGKGKACKNIRRLALLPAKPLDAEVLSKAAIEYMKTSVTSSKPFNAYVKRLEATYELPPFAFATRIECHDDEKNQFMLSFQDVANFSHNDDLMNVLVQRREANGDEIMFPYAPPPDEQPKKKPAAKGARGKY